MVESNYDILAIVEGSTEKEIRDAFRRLALQFHSDRGGENEQFIKIKQAYDDLKIGKKYPETDQEKLRNSKVYSGDTEADIRRKNQILGQELFKEMKTAEEWAAELNKSNSTATRLFGSKTLGEIELERKATGALSIKGNFMAGSLTFDGPIVMQGSITSPSWTQEFKTNTLKAFLRSGANTPLCPSRFARGKITECLFLKYRSIVNLSRARSSTPIKVS